MEGGIEIGGFLAVTELCSIVEISKKWLAGGGFRGLGEREILGLSEEGGGDGLAGFGVQGAGLVEFAEVGIGRI